MDYMYHGSTTQNIKVLEPRKRYTPAGKIEYAAIYATPLQAFAVAHGFPWSSEEGIGLDVASDIVSISIPSKLRGRLQVPLSIYKVSKDSFEHTKEEESGYTWHSAKSVPVVEEIKFSTVEEAMKVVGMTVEFV